MIRLLSQLQLALWFDCFCPLREQVVPVCQHSRTPMRIRKPNLLPKNLGRSRKQRDAVSKSSCSRAAFEMLSGGFVCVSSDHEKLTRLVRRNPHKRSSEAPRADSIDVPRTFVAVHLSGLQLVTWTGTYGLFMTSLRCLLLHHRKLRQFPIPPLWLSKDLFNFDLKARQNRIPV